MSHTYSYSTTLYVQPAQGIDAASPKESTLPNVVRSLEELAVDIHALSSRLLHSTFLTPAIQEQGCGKTPPTEKQSYTSALIAIGDTLAAARNQLTELERLLAHHLEDRQIA